MEVQDKIITKLIERDELLEHIVTRMATKEDFNRLSNAQDEMMVILKRLDQERYATTDRIRRLEFDVEKVKMQLHIV